MRTQIKYYWWVILIGSAHLLIPGEWIFGFLGVGFITSLAIVTTQIYLFRKGRKSATTEDSSSYSPALRVIAIISILYSAYTVLFHIFGFIGLLAAF